MSQQKTPIGEKPIKKKGLEIDDDYDFAFVKNKSNVLRWILVLPMGILGFLLITLTCGFIIDRLLSYLNENSLINYIINGIFNLLKFSTAMVAMVATSPTKNKFKVGCILSILPLLFIVGAIYAYTNNSVVGSIPLSSFLINFVGVVLGVAFALWNIKKETSKKGNDNVIE